MFSITNNTAPNVTADPYTVPFTTSGTVTIEPNISKIRLMNDNVVKFDDGFEITGRELAICMRLLRKMAIEEMPEEFI